MRSRPDGQARGKTAYLSPYTAPQTWGFLSRAPFAVDFVPDGLNEVEQSRGFEGEAELLDSSFR